MRWLFPDNKKAENASVLDQALKVREEGNETFSAALNKEGDRRIVEEALDTIQAAEGLLRKYPEGLVLATKAKVKLKCTRRGDYR